VQANSVQVNIVGNVLLLSLPGSVLSLTQENASNLDSVGRMSYHTRRQSGLNLHIVLKKIVSLSLHYFLSTGCYLSRLPIIATLKSHLHVALATQNTTEEECIISYTQNTAAIQSSEFFNCNTSVTDHKQRTVDFPHNKQLPRSTANCTVSDIRRKQSEEYSVKPFIKILRMTSNCVSTI